MVGRPSPAIPQPQVKSDQTPLTSGVPRKKFQGGGHPSIRALTIFRPHADSPCKKIAGKGAWISKLPSPCVYAIAIDPLNLTASECKNDDFCLTDFFTLLSPTPPWRVYSGSPNQFNRIKYECRPPPTGGKFFRPAEQQINPEKVKRPLEGGKQRTAKGLP